MKKELIEYLSQFAHENRVDLFNEKIEQRTNHVTLVLEDIYQAQNTSAAIRTSDCFGIQNVHVIENSNEFNVYKDITLGSSNWLNINKYNKEENNSKACFDSLKKQGYKIVATSPLQHHDSVFEFSVDDKIALVLGNELNGISEIAKQEADEFITIPMYGFTESFNISVSAALCLSEISKRVRESDIDWKLSEEEKNDMLIKWYKHSIKHGKKLAKEFKKNFKEK
ncbi:MAG: RNA methyltransferase [Flavobacteriales bacterium]|nr:RNA methyltransferase [Flavobacteriales bacterium]